MPKRIPTPLKNQGKSNKRPAKSSREREDELTSLAYDLVEQRIREGSASSQETVHFLRAPKVRLESDILRKKIELMDAQISALKSQAHIEELYEKALNSMKIYNGEDPDEEDDDED